MRREIRERMWLGLVPVWTVVVCIGLGQMWRYAWTPGLAMAAPATWPADLPFKPAERGTTLVLALHPQCPCSDATVEELDKLMTRGAGNVTCYVLMVRPAGVPAGWEHSGLWDRAAAINGVHLMSDEQGKWSARLGAMTSGQTYAFDAAGRLLFSGGITDSRGHAGDNAGTAAIEAILSGQKPVQTQTRVYGCSLGIGQRPVSAGGGK